MKRGVAAIMACIALIYCIIPIGATEKYYCKRNDENKIALTFDDGPHPKYTLQILNILKKYNIKATFFVIGINVKNYGEALKAVKLDGHQIGNHTFTHEYINGKLPQKIYEDIKDCRDIVRDMCDVETTVFRPPGGIMSDDIYVSGSDIFNGYDIIYWTLDTMDWAHRSPNEISDYVISNVKSGDIILMHDYIGENSPTPQALEIMLPRLIELGYEFVTVSELIE